MHDRPPRWSASRVALLESSGTVGPGHGVSQAARVEGFSLVEVVVATAVFLALLGMTLAFMNAQARLGKQQQTVAFGAAEVQRIENRVAGVLRSCVYAPVAGWPAGSDLSTAPAELFARVKLYRIVRTQPFTVTYPVKLALDLASPCVLGVWDDAAGNWVAKSAPKGTMGKLVYGVDANGDGLPDAGTAVALGERVTVFQVTSSPSAPDLLEVKIELEIKTGSREVNVKLANAGRAEVERPQATGQILVSRYDPATMQ